MDKQKENMEGWLKARCSTDMEKYIRDKAEEQHRDPSNLLRLIVAEYQEKNPLKNKGAN